MVLTPMRTPCPPKQDPRRPSLSSLTTTREGGIAGRNQLETPAPLPGVCCATHPHLKQSYRPGVVVPPIRI